MTDKLRTRVRNTCLELRHEEMPFFDDVADLLEELQDELEYRTAAARWLLEYCDERDYAIRRWPWLEGE